MYVRIFLGIAMLFVMTGCATTQGKPQVDQVQNRVTELEKKVEEKDAEIVDLQYQVKDLSSKLESSPSKGADSQESSAPVARVSASNQVMRVDVSVEKVQTALKNAGFYSGKIDGKIGQGTRQAIMDFQKSVGLKADGVVGRRTWQDMKKYLHKSADASASKS